MVCMSSILHGEIFILLFRLTADLLYFCQRAPFCRSAVIVEIVFSLQCDRFSCTVRNGAERMQ